MSTLCCDNISPKNGPRTVIVSASLPGDLQSTSTATITGASSGAFTAPAYLYQMVSPSINVLEIDTSSCLFTMSANGTLTSTVAVVPTSVLPTTSIANTQPLACFGSDMTEGTSYYAYINSSGVLMIMSMLSSTINQATGFTAGAHSLQSIVFTWAK